MEEKLAKDFAVIAIDEVRTLIRACKATVDVSTDCQRSAIA